MFRPKVAFGNVLGLVLSLLATSAFAQTWEERIASARATSQALDQLAIDQGAGPIGSFYRSVDAEAHRCSVLAEFLNAGDVLEYLELTGPDIRVAHDQNPYVQSPDDLAVFAQSVGIWAYTAETILGMSKDEQLELWQLSCEDKLGIPAGLISSGWDRRASFRIEPGALTVLGQFNTGFFNEFEAVLREGDFNYVYLGSGGGSVVDAIAAANLIRELGIQTDLYADCESACALAFLGGSKRLIYNLPYRLGFHQAALRDGTPVPLDHPVYAHVKEFADALDVDGDFVVAAMQSALPAEMNYPAYQALCDANVAWVYGNCTQPFPQ